MGTHDYYATWLSWRQTHLYSPALQQAFSVCAKKPHVRQG